MNKPASELIALADNQATREEVLALAINNELCRQIDAGEKMDSLRVTSKIVALPIVQGLLAANQSGSERAGVDRAKLAEWADDFEAAAHEVPRGIKSTILMTRAQEVRVALATPPAQPAPVSGESSTSSDGGSMEQPFALADAVRETPAPRASSGKQEGRTGSEVGAKKIAGSSMSCGPDKPIIAGQAPSPSESTHGKPDGAVREALSALVNAVSNMRVPQNVADAALQITIIGPVLERAKAALHSPKIAAAETSLEWPSELHPATLDLVKRFAVALASKLHAAQEKYDYYDGWTDTAWKAACQRQLIEHLAKGDPRDVAAYCAFMWHHGWPTADPSAPRAEAKSQEPEAVAINGRAYGTDVIDRLSERKLNCRQLSRYIWDRAHNEPDCFEQDIARLIQNERREAVKRATAHPTTKPEARDRTHAHE